MVPDTPPKSSRLRSFAAASRVQEASARLLPGLLVATLIAVAVRYLSDHLGWPAMLYALLIGMAFHVLADDARFLPGLRVASRHVLRTGVALLGLRITTTEVAGLGWPIVGLVLTGVAVTLVAGWGIGRACGLRNSHAVLSAGAVAICGASAALAIASVLPKHENHERNTILTVAIVTALSTVAMVAYPVLVSWLGYDDVTAGVFLGATIHDVAQVVGAGYIVSVDTGDTSTLIKLIRVACLVPVVIALSLLVRGSQPAEGRREPLVPLFLLAFVVLVLANSAGLIPATASSALVPVSGWCLLTAVAALGVRTTLESLVRVGPLPVLAMLLQTALLGLVILAGLAALGAGPGLR
jgi:uncharacterized integral membrane protein (TIGR00698 family)